MVGSESLPLGWASSPAEQLFEKAPGPRESVPRSEYGKSGRFPVVDQGKSSVAGFTNFEDAVYRGPFPVIVFGDHTREVKLRTEPFAVGADGTQLLRATKIEPHYLYYALKFANLRSLGYSRHFRLLREHVVRYPCDLGEQRRVVRILAAADDAIDAAERAAAYLNTLQAGYFGHFVRTLEERTQVTDVGRLPASWRRVDLGSILESVRCPVDVEPSATYEEIGVRSHFRGIFQKSPCLGADLGAKRVFWVVPDCLLFNIVFAWEGAVALTGNNEQGRIASHRFPMFRTDPEVVSPAFVLNLLQLPTARQFLRVISPGAAGRNKTLNQGRLLRAKVAIPEVRVQEQALDRLGALAGASQAAAEVVAQHHTLRECVANDLLAGAMLIPKDQE